MLRNTGKPTEDVFEQSITALGKRGYFHRVMDASAVKGMTGKIGHVPPAPSDYVIVVDGVIEFAEVKSTHDQTKFPFSLLKKGQKADGMRIVAAGGLYRVYVRRMADDTWFRVPMHFIIAVRNAGKQSIPWDLMEQFKWNINWKTSTVRT